MTHPRPTAEEYERAWIKWDATARAGAHGRPPLFNFAQRMALLLFVLASLLLLVALRHLAEEQKAAKNIPSLPSLPSVEH